MLWLKRVKVAQYERALVYRDRNLEAVLGPGKYRLRSAASSKSRCTT